MFKKSLFTVLMLASLVLPFSVRADVGSFHHGGYLPPPYDNGYPPYGGGGYCSIDYGRAGQIVDALYNGILFRAADPGGRYDRVNAIVSQGTWSVANQAREIAESPEFRQNIAYRYGARQIVTQMYRGLLGRNPDHAGMQGWVELVRQGRFGDAAAGIAGSQEFNNRFGLCQ